MNHFVLPPPPGPDTVRQLVLERFASVFESQTRAHLFANSITELTTTVHAEIMDGLHAALDGVSALPTDDGEKPIITHAIDRLLARCTRLETTLGLLVGQWRRQQDRNGQNLQQILIEFNRTERALADTVIERDLLERHSRVLDSIVLTHETVTHWETAVQDILTRFRAVFPFNVFFIAFAQDNTLALHIYYFSNYSDVEKRKARRKLSREMLGQLHLSADAPLDIKEFQIADDDESEGSIADIRLLTVPVDSLDSSNLAGMLGVAYGAAASISPPQLSIVNSILSVMVMVVSSSKTLSRTLSELEYYSSHDPLTGLYNRRYFNQILEYECGRSTRHHHEFSILLIDLDDFKDVNDTYGHPCGDGVLRCVADTICDNMRQGDLATRIGGDEFAVILVETGTSGATIVAEKLRSEIRALVFDGADNKKFHITASIGIATFPGDAESVTDLMAGVDIGLYHAKGLGKDGIGTVDSVKDRVQVSRTNRDYAEQLRTALRDDQVLPYYQTIFDCRTGTPYAHETLARILMPGGDVLSAGMFIDTIEKYGLGRELDRVIIQKSLAAAKQRIDAQRYPSRLFINLSAQEIQGRGILGYAEQVCAKLDIPPNHIVFEVLERDAISDMTHMRKFLSNLREKGFLFALDDFGSGYNSFHYLRELSFDYVKIDGAFVRNILKSKIDYALVRNLTRLCQDLGILTVAEFVESEGILDALRSMDVDYVQGFHLSVPAPVLRSWPAQPGAD